ncbi:MAG: patatin-like phospholipase family protein [Verrucomicrobiales bacterium]
MSTTSGSHRVPDLEPRQIALDLEATAQHRRFSISGRNNRPPRQGMVVAGLSELPDNFFAALECEAYAFGGLASLGDSGESHQSNGGSPILRWDQAWPVWVYALQQCARVWLVSRPEQEMLPQAYAIKTALEEQGVEVKLLLFLEGTGQAQGWFREAKGFNVAADRVWRNDVPRDRQVRSLIREFRKERLGLVLSSGGAKGLAHAGVLQVLEEHGIEFDAVSGTSMGAYVGALYACGVSSEGMEQLALDCANPWKMLKLLDPVFPPRRGFLRGENVMARLRESVGYTELQELSVPLRITSVRVDTLEREVFDDGDLARAVLASACIPGVCEPVEFRGCHYIDGGIADPVPVRPLLEMGVERILAVNTIPNPSDMVNCLKLDQEQAAQQAGLPGLVSKHLNWFSRGNILDILFRATHGAQMRLAAQASAGADVIIRPVQCNSRWHDFRHAADYVALGRRAAEDMLPKILEFASSTSNPQEHHESTSKSMGIPARIHTA